MKPWWRAEPLSEEEEQVLRLLFEAHDASCYRNNVSSVTVANATQGSNDVGKAIAAAILTLGVRHAPLEQTCEFLRHERPWDLVEPMLDAQQKIPGWGGTYQKKGNADPMWTEVDDILELYYPELHNKLQAVTHHLRKHGKDISPNPSAYTASVAIALGMPSKLAVYLFISARLDAWAQIAFHNLE